VLISDEKTFTANVIAGFRAICEGAYGKILLLDFDRHFTKFTVGSRHVTVSKSSRAAAGGTSACVGH
jgi:hypothetical protein